ncbi:MAG: cysteine--tRNA ligase [Saprospiraceae bacterium]
MKSQFSVYNSLTKKKEVFKPLIADRVGMYVCGPTVYSNAHLGNCRTFTSFDLIYRYLTHLNYKVRYVRNITDVGHLENEEDMTGEDKIAKKARLEQIEPMEIVQRYTLDFKNVMSMLNNHPPSIEPTATGHIIEQIEMVQKILDNGYAYERNGSVYFKTVQFAEKHDEYGQLSGKKIEDLRQETRDLKAQSEKDHPADFAIWMKAHENHIMRWDSPWSVGFPGWHLECSAMSTKYLGERFDIHGGGMDLQFPHHENEIAQNVSCCETSPASYWMHTNMLTFEGVKMSKSLNNSILPEELFTGNNHLLSQAYSPMTLRFFFLRSHYRSICDFSDKGLQDAEKNYKNMMSALKAVQELEYIGKEKVNDEDKVINDLLDQCFIHLDDDLNTPRVLATLFELVAKINAFKNKQLKINHISKATLERMQTTFKIVLQDILGLLPEEENSDAVLDNVLQVLIEMRKTARANKDWAASDLIRDQLLAAGIQLKDGADGTSWSKL